MKTLADENLLTDAIDFDSEREAFLTLFRAGHSTAEYIAWAEDFDFTILNDQGTNVEKYFRLNHYIYWVKNALENEVKIGRQDEDESNKYLNPEDFCWILKQSVRDDIFYEGITQESRTTDLVEYRLNWFDKDGNAFMTFRDYCEWINIYAYNDEYKIDRGDLGKEIGDLAGSLGIEGNEDNNEQLNSTDGWLTIEAFAVWKRMEKYENNIEYLNKIGTTSGQEAITAPILKRQISTTVFPKIYNSGEQSANSAGAATGNHILKTSGDNANAHDYYDWPRDVTMDENHARPFKDVYEYNERYEEREIARIINSDKQNQQYFFEATRLIDDPKFSAECDQNCGGPHSCQNPNHAAYQVQQWINRYGAQGLECVGPNDYHVWLKLDEKQLEGLKPAKVDGKYYYRQLYVPFDYFKRACQMIKVHYQNTNYKGYHNYMKYWARNGAWNWICNQSEYSGRLVASLFVKVDKTYMVTSFWNNYDGNKSPIDGHEGLNGANVDGKGGAKAYGDFGQQN